MKETLLLVGCGDVAHRAVSWLTHRFRILALVRNPAAMPLWRQSGCTPILADIDDAQSLVNLPSRIQRVLYLAPPPDHGTSDTRMTQFLQALAQRRGSLPARLVYVSTSGVYGDCGGRSVDERTPLAPITDRARRRVDAETQLRHWERTQRSAVIVLRAPGIYAQNRLPINRLRERLPVLVAEEDVWTNHIHADDLARACCLALFRGRAGQVFNVVDDGRMKMGDYFDAVAYACGLPRPPRRSLEHLSRQVSEAQLSFMSESRQLDNQMMKKVLRLRLAYPTVSATLQTLTRQG